MDPVSTAISIFKVAFEAFQALQGKGYLGGSTNWTTYVGDFAAIAQNFASFINTAASNPGVYDSLTEADIRARLLPESWDEKEARIKKELGTA